MRVLFSFKSLKQAIIHTCWLAFNPVKDFIDVGYLFIYFLLLPAWFSGLWLNYPIQWDPRHWAKSQLRLFPWVRRGKTETRCLVMLHTHGRDLILFFFSRFTHHQREREREIFFHDTTPIRHDSSTCTETKKKNNFFCQELDSIITLLTRIEMMLL